MNKWKIRKCRYCFDSDAHWILVDRAGFSTYVPSWQVALGAFLIATGVTAG